MKATSITLDTIALKNLQELKEYHNDMNQSAIIRWALWIATKHINDELYDK